MELAENLKLKIQFKNRMPGKDYWYSLKSRCLDLTICTQIKVHMMTTEVVRKYFVDLKAFVTRLGLQDKPQQI